MSVYDEILKNNAAQAEERRKAEIDRLQEAQRDIITSVGQESSSSKKAWDKRRSKWGPYQKHLQAYAN